MPPQLAVEAFRGALLEAVWVSMPVLVIGVAAGIVISVVQILTSIQDSAFAAVPRLLMFVLALVIFMPWMLLRLVSYAARVLGDFTAYAR